MQQNRNEMDLDVGCDMMESRKKLVRGNVR